MAILAKVTFKGASGKDYVFNEYKLGTDFKAIGAVYIFARKVTKQDNSVVYPVVYVGETGNLSERFTDHHKAECIRFNGAECISILAQEDEKIRLAIEEDLIDNYDPPCND